MNKNLSVLLKGFAVGAGMSVPGVSGGTMAMILGVYEKLVASVSRVFKEPRERLPFLAVFALGGAVGVLTAAGVISALLYTAAGIPLRYAFLGAVAGGIPLIFRRAKLKQLTLKSTALILAGAAAVVIIGLIPEGLFRVGNGGAAYILIQLAGGLLVAAALVLPGISASHIMYVLGIYESAAGSLSEGRFLALLPLAAGVIVGTFLSARVLERLFSRHEQGCCLVIFGFMAASLTELVPSGADLFQTLLGVVCACGSFLAVRLLCRKEEQMQTD